MPIPRFLRLLLASLLALLVVTPALADPINNPKVFTVPLTCADQQFTVVTLDNASGTGWLVTGTRVTVASEVAITTTFTDPVTGEPITSTEASTFGPGH